LAIFNVMIDSIKHIVPDQLTPDPALQEVVHLLLNVIEQQSARIRELEWKSEVLESEAKRLKTGQGNLPKNKPKVPKPREKQPEKTEARQSKNHKSGPKNKTVEIDREVKIKTSGLQLPSDAVFKGFRKVVVQNVVLKRDNVCYLVPQFYSASEKKLYTPPIPGCIGEFGAELHALLLTLHNVCGVTQGSLEKLLDNAGVQISAGTINNILQSQCEQMRSEQADILLAGLESSPYVGMDSTKSLEKGKRLSTQVMCGDFFTVYSTLEGKTRRDVLSALQGTERDNLLFHYNESTVSWLEHFDIRAHNKDLLEACFRGLAPFNMETFVEKLEAVSPGLTQRPLFVRIADAFALGHYHMQKNWPVLKLLMSDQGGEYSCVASEGQMFCWIHDERPYRMLCPEVAFHEQLLARFRSDYWNFYEQLLKFKELPAAEQKQQSAYLEAEFDRIFTQKTNYDNLDRQIAKTFAKKEQLLLVLKHPFLPLHNNAAELAVRQKVRKRDISFHTMSKAGTQTQDAFMTVVETARKLCVSAFDYIADRVSQRYQMTPLANMVRMAYAQ